MEEVVLLADLCGSCWFLVELLVLLVGSFGAIFGLTKSAFLGICF